MPEQNNPRVIAPNVDVLIIGAGAAGMMCAIEAARRGRSVLLLDHAKNLAEKIRISGGGRCNFTNLNANPENYLSHNPHFCRSALARYTPRHFIALLQKHNIGYHEKTLGQLFCDEGSEAIIEMLKNKCDEAGVRWCMPCEIGEIKHEKKFHVSTSRGEFEAESLVIATGGLSIPKIGATPFGYHVAEQFGIPVTRLRPGLVPLSFAPNDWKPYADLTGVSVEAVVSYGLGTTKNRREQVDMQDAAQRVTRPTNEVGEERSSTQRSRSTAQQVIGGSQKQSFRENLLFTHRGLSGPAILQISSYWEPGQPLHINLLPDKNMAEIFAQQRGSRMLLTNFLAQYLPRHFAEIWCAQLAENKPLNQYADKKLAALAARLHDWQITPSGTLGYAKAEVTCGGVDTRALSSKTMECNEVPGLYFIGEVMDVTGQLGGYNFQWAWSSGYAAGQAV